MDERIRSLREHIQALNDAGVRRTTFFGLVAASLKQTIGEPRPIRRAKAFAHLLDNVEQVVLPHELIAGSILGMWPVAEDLPSYAERRQEAIAVLEKYRARKHEPGWKPDRSQRNALYGRIHYDANIEYADLQKLIAEMGDYFSEADDLSHQEIARELTAHFNFDYGEETRQLFAELPWVTANHLDLNCPKLLRLGLGGILADIQDRLSRAQDEDKRMFYESTRLAIEAAIRFTRRYAQTLIAEASRPETGPQRAEELREMAAICQTIAARPPKTFREALQLVWMVYTIANIGGGSAMSFARFDQYMYPFYAQDLASGSLSRDEAKELISCLWLKVNEPHMRTVISLCLGGTMADGNDAANELTELCLEVCGELRMPYPNLALRISRKTPEWVYDRAVETILLGTSHPMLLNDDVWIPNLERRGYATADARDYYNMGCVEMMVQGKQPNWRGVGGVDFPAVFELVFRNGEANFVGDTGIPTGTLDSFHTFEQFFDAYCAQIRHLLARAQRNAKAQDAAWKDRFYDPFGSALIDDCLERGLDLFQGGSRYPPVCASSAYGLGTAADSLAAIKKFVFDERRLTLHELWQALEADFVGYEDLRMMLNHDTPCYGNDLDEVDDLARRIFDVFADTVHSFNDGTVHGTFATALFSYTSHVKRGELIPATPNGRRAWTPISDCIGPSQGKDVCGPTALLNSITKLDSSKITGACAVNLKLTPSAVRGPAGREALKSLLKTYLKNGGIQIQVNFVDQETLRDAQIHPENHRDLIVRVAGFSEYFTCLDRSLQDEIITRAAHGV